MQSETVFSGKEHSWDLVANDSQDQFVPKFELWGYDEKGERVQLATFEQAPTREDCEKIWLEK